MNPLERTLIEKAGHDNGFEYSKGLDVLKVTLASARHRTQAQVAMASGDYVVRFHPASPALLPELQRSYWQSSTIDGALFKEASLAGLGKLLRRAANLSQALPSQALEDYGVAVEKELATLPAGLGGTEIERTVRQRIGQDRFRAALFDYWSGSCAVTGVALPEVLRASHTKPWAECDSDAERLDVFNGFLLIANLDALFDRFLISFDDGGQLIVSPRLTHKQTDQLGIHRVLKLRWFTDTHRKYVAFHRARFQLLVEASFSVSADRGGDLS
jgi:hypothetical protein